VEPAGTAWGGDGAGVPTAVIDTATNRVISI
jgi:hypothetical protein